MLELELMTKEDAAKAALDICSPACNPTFENCPPRRCNPVNPCPPR